MVLRNFELEESLKIEKELHDEKIDELTEAFARIKVLETALDKCFEAMRVR